MNGEIREVSFDRGKEAYASVVCCGRRPFLRTIPAMLLDTGWMQSMRADALPEVNGYTDMREG